MDLLWVDAIQYLKYSPSRLSFLYHIISNDNNPPAPTKEVTKEFPEFNIRCFFVVERELLSNFWRAFTDLSRIANMKVAAGTALVLIIITAY